MAIVVEGRAEAKEGALSVVRMEGEATVGVVNGESDIKKMFFLHGWTLEHTLQLRNQQATASVPRKVDT